MRLETRVFEGSIVIGLSIDRVHLMPVLIFPTWAEYVTFITKQCNFIELEYRREASLAPMKAAISEFVNSIVTIDEVGHAV